MPAPATALVAIVIAATCALLPAAPPPLAFWIGTIAAVLIGVSSR